MKKIIYKVTNVLNKMVYIGATSKTIKERKQDHISKAKQGSTIKFHQAIGTYGSDAFEWKQLDTAESKEELALKEQSYVYEYDSKINGYNSDVGGGVSKPVYMYSLEGELVERFNSLKEACVHTGYSKQSISQACLGQIKSSHSYYWSYQYKDGYEPVKDSKLKEVCQYNLNGELVGVYESVKKASEAVDVAKGSIAKACRGERKTIKKFIWKYS